jgi:Ner family transcriptional regulator
MAEAPGPGWHVEDIKAELRKRLGSLTALSEAWGYHPSAISNAIARPYSSRIEQRVATALSLPPHILWPDRWTPEGHPRPRPVTGRPKPSRGPEPQERQKARVA